jgi:hypothetical protein
MMCSLCVECVLSRAPAEESQIKGPKREMGREGERRGEKGREGERRGEKGRETSLPSRFRV